jgi:16S rRNA (guanine(527)-N(7))-methyltransferase RsmG
MTNQEHYENQDADIWQKFAEQENLSAQALEQFKRYAALLEEWRERINLTTITGTANIIRNHFQDSLEVARFIDVKKVNTICDVGTGGGFPGLPLKIKFPHLSVVLIEVNNKKVQFLTTVIHELGLDNVTISDLDWRTFLRKTDYEIDLFCARASLHTDELIRLFKPGCRYKSARLIYWASHDWQPGQEEGPYVKSEYAYQLGSKKRRYILMSAV